MPEHSVAGRSKQQGQEGLSREGKDILPACEDMGHRGRGGFCLVQIIPWWVSSLCDVERRAERMSPPEERVGREGPRRSLRREVVVYCRMGVCRVQRIPLAFLAKKTGETHPRNGFEKGGVLKGPFPFIKTPSWSKSTDLLVIASVIQWDVGL